MADFDGDEIYVDKDNTFYLKVDKLDIQELLKYKYLEELNVVEYIVDDINLTQLINLRKLTININNDITIILPKSLEDITILNTAFNECKINLINYENLINILRN